MLVWKHQRDSRESRHLLCMVSAQHSLVNVFGMKRVNAWLVPKDVNLLQKRSREKSQKRCLTIKLRRSASWVYVLNALLVICWNHWKPCQSRFIPCVWKIGLIIDMLVLAQNDFLEATKYEKMVLCLLFRAKVDQMVYQLLVRFTILQRKFEAHS